MTKRKFAEMVLASMILVLSSKDNASAANKVKPEAAPVYSWQEPHAKVLETGGIEWAPKPFVFEAGASPRYIDFENGDDTRDGKTSLSAWKHHPWDANATGKAKACKGIHTYVFKGGTVYRGTLKAAESGIRDNPIRLTCDPHWGDGSAALYGSIFIKGGWKKANAEETPGIPHPENIWYIDLGTNFDAEARDTQLSAMWQVVGNEVKRLHIAREPNYNFSDPNNPVKDWPIWTNYDKDSGTLTSPFLKGLGGKELLKGAVIWSEADFLMGSARKLNVPWDYDPEAGTVKNPLLANSRWFKRLPKAWVHFMIENVPQFLDAPGEYFFDSDGPKPGRLYLFPPDGMDPNAAKYEIAHISNLISIVDRHDIVISGLEFRFNDPDKGTPPGFSVSQARAPARFSIGEGSASACVRIVGDCANITVENCKFFHVADAVTAYPKTLDVQPVLTATTMDHIIVSDNDIAHVELGGAITLVGDSERTPGVPYGSLKHAEVLRNRIFDSGFRHGYSPWSSIPAICVYVPEICEVAGNVVDTSFGNGIITYGGKSSPAYNAAPLTRILVHHNRLDNTMLGCNDYGGLEHFQGGPVYIYNNVIRNCVGNRTLGRELGYSLYLDGGFKCYSFNNIMAGNVKAGEPDYYNNCGYFMVFGFMDQLFNNTIYHFDNALDGSSGNRSNILGNLMMDCKTAFIRQNRPGDVSMLQGGDTGEMGRSGIPTMSYASNVFFGNPKTFGIIGGIGKNSGDRNAPVLSGSTLDELRQNLEDQQCRLPDVGWLLAGAPLVAPHKKDYRPVPNCGVEGRGVKYFVPWALARNVGEWNFYKSNSNPNVVLGEGFYMTEEYVERGMYYFIPRNDLTVPNCSEKDYVAGPLEDWTEGALAFDGKRIAFLSHAEITKSMDYPAGWNSGVNHYDGSKRETVDMADNNFLIEIVFKTEPGHANGVLVSKLAKAGYALSISPDGKACLTLKAGKDNASAASTVKVNDGKWHHVIAEVDRKAGKVAIYVDGAMAGGGKLNVLTKDARLSNSTDFIVGQGFSGAVDFLRVCRSTLAESKTTIQELYAWEFDGPFLRDFTGKLPAKGKRDAGAIEVAPLAPVQ